MRTGLAVWLPPTLLLLARMAGPIAAEAATIWTGPVITFTNLAGSDPTQPANQDRITSDVWLTRATTEGLYNAEMETSFTHFFSPADTEWADGTTAGYSSLTYTDWDTWSKNLHGGPPKTVGVNAVVHLISDDIYINIQFTSWGGNGGGFSYQRSTSPPPGISITNLSVTGGTVTINFTGSSSDAPSAFTLLGSAAVNGTYSTAADASIIQVSPGLFQATAPTNGPNQFYRILK